jgi:hypothetical protein
MYLIEFHIMPMLNYNVIIISRPDFHKFCRQNKRNYGSNRQGDLFWAQLMIIKWPSCSIFLLLLALHIYNEEG